MVAAWPGQKAGLYASVTGARPDSTAVLHGISELSRWTGVAPSGNRWPSKKSARGHRVAWRRERPSRGPGTGWNAISKTDRYHPWGHEALKRHPLVFRAIGSERPDRRFRHRHAGGGFEGDDRDYSVPPRSSSSALSLRISASASRRALASLSALLVSAAARLSASRRLACSSSGVSRNSPLTGSRNRNSPASQHRSRPSTALWPQIRPSGSWTISIGWYSPSTSSSPARAET